MEIMYFRNGDYFFPEMGLTEEEQRPVGKYGLMRQEYLQEHRNAMLRGDWGLCHQQASTHFLKCALLATIVHFLRSAHCLPQYVFPAHTASVPYTAVQ